VVASRECELLGYFFRRLDPAQRGVGELPRCKMGDQTLLAHGGCGSRRGVWLQRTVAHRQTLPETARTKIVTALPSMQSTETTASPDAQHAHFRAVERFALLFGLLLLLASFLPGFQPWRASLGYGVGLGLANAHAIRFFGERLARRRSVGLLVVLFQAKLAVLGVLLYVGLKFFSLSGVGVCVGLSVLPLAIVARAVQWGAAAPASKSEGKGELLTNG